MIGLETREREYFLTVADELHFDRATVRLPIAPAGAVEGEFAGSEP